MATPNLNPNTGPKYDTKGRNPDNDIINNLPTSQLSKRMRAVRRKVYERKTDMESYQDRLDAEADWEYADKQAEIYHPDIDERDWRAHLNLPDSFAAIQAQAQETIERKSRPLLERVEDEDKDIEEFQNAVMTHNMDVTGFDYQHFLAKYVASYRGTSHLWEFYRLERRKVRFPVGVDNETGAIKYEIKEITDWDDSYTMFIENEYILTDEAATDDEDMIDCIRREILEIEEFHRLYDNKPGFENQEYVMPGGETTTRSYFKLPSDMREQDVEVLHYHNKSTDEYLVCANNIPIHDGPLESTHKQLPLATVYQYRRPGRYWGMGIPKAIEHLSAERASIRNLKLDRNKLDLNKMFLYNKAYHLDDEDLAPRPHGLIGVETNGQPLRDVIQPIEYAQQGVGESFTTEDVLLDDIRRTTGIDDRIQGIEKGGTATEAAILKESSLKRLNMLMILNEMDTLVRIGRLKWANISFFYPTPKIERLFDDEGNVTKEIKSFRKIKVKGKSFDIKTDDTDNTKKKLVMSEVPHSSVIKVNGDYAQYMQGEVDVVMKAMPSLGNTKAIKQAKITEMLTTIAAVEPWIAELDSRKAVHELLDVNELDPDKWLKGTGMTSDQMRALADAEIEIMKRGIPVSPTEGATEEHMIQEMQYVNSPQFQSLPEEIKTLIEDHVIAELDSQSGLEGALSKAFGSTNQPANTVQGGAAPNIQATNSGGNQPQVADLSGARQNVSE